MEENGRISLPSKDHDAEESPSERDSVQQNVAEVSNSSSAPDSDRVPSDDATAVSLPETNSQTTSEPHPPHDDEDTKNKDGVNLSEEDCNNNE